MQSSRPKSKRPIICPPTASIVTSIRYRWRTVVSTGDRRGQVAHRDNRNSDYISLPSPYAMRRTWTGIEGANFFMGPTIGANGRIYATSARGEGYSHLHAYDTRGNLVWKTEPMQDWDDFDSAAFMSAPVTDVDGNLFIPDSNQPWSFDPSGNTRWVTRLSDVGIAGYIF